MMAYSRHCLKDIQTNRKYHHMTVNLHLQVCQSVSQIALCHCIIRCFSLPNFQGCRLKVPSSFDIDLWRDSLVGYNDNIVDFLEYSWPVGYNKIELPVTSFRNHNSALLHEKHIDKCIETELRYNALIGPFEENSFDIPLATSPLMPVPKKDSIEHRTVVDLSFSPGSSVNDGIPSDMYLSENFKLSQH